MRKLKGGKEKETKKQKLERKKENKEIQEKMKSVVFPVLGQY